MNIFIWIVLGLFGEWLAKRLVPERKDEAIPVRESNGDTDVEVRGARLPDTSPPPPSWRRGAAALSSGREHIA